MEIIYKGKGLQFSTYENVTPTINGDGYWVVDGKITTIKAQGADGASFSGVEELYYAALANAANQGKPDWPDDGDMPTESQLLNWKGTIQETQFGKKVEEGKENAGVTYKYLWNVEKIITEDAKGEESFEYTKPNLIQIYEGGRIPAEYVSYYAGSQSLEPPPNQPTLGENGNSIVFKDSQDKEISNPGTWEENGVVADSYNYLFEITFVRYAEKDENGRNLYAKIHQEPTLIGRNGADALTLSLNNDSDVVAISASGEVGGSLPSVVAALSMNGSPYKGQIALEVDADNWSEEEEGAASQKGNYTFSQNENNGTATLTITKLPTNFSEASFTFLYNNISRVFHITARQSEVDYNLSFEQTLINSSDSEGTIQVKVKKTNASGAVEYISTANQGAESNIYLSYKDGTGNYNLVTPPNNGENISDQQKWIFSYEKDRVMPLYFKIEEAITTQGGAASYFEWDSEAIEFIHDAPAIRINSDKLQFNVNSDGELYDTQNATLTLWGRGVDVDRAVWHTDGEYLGEGSVIQVSPELFDGEIPANNQAVTSKHRLKFLYAKNGRVFTGGTGATIYYTTNNNNWSPTIHTEGTGTKDIMGGTYFKGKYYIVAYNGYLYVFDERGYEASKLEQLSKIETIATNGKIIIAVGQGTGTQDQAEEEWPLQYLYSTDGANWNKGLSTEIADTFTSICLTNDGFFACGNKTNTAYLINEDGTPKKEIELPAFTEGYNLRCVYYNNGKYFIGQHQKYNSILVGTRSSSGIEWTSATIGASYSIRSITYFNGLYWAFGYKSGVKGNVIYKSSDGSNWEEHTTTNGDEGIWCSTIISNQLYYAGEKGNITKFQTSNSIAITAAVDDVYDTLSLTKVYDGAVAQDFSVTASAYAFVESTTSSVDEIELKADLKNLTGTVKWYKGTSDLQKEGENLTIYRTEQADDKSKPYGVGTYTAKLYKNDSPTDWEDSVIIGQVSDGATGSDGKPAISISLTNPTMVFNSNNSSETETCKVIVYEGGTTLSPGSGNGKFSITAVSENASQDVIKDDTITIANPTAATTKTYEVRIKPTAGGDEQTSTITINCTLVDDGEDGIYISLQAEPSVIHSTDLNSEGVITFTAFEKVGGKETKPLALTNTLYYYTYQWDSQTATKGSTFSSDTFTVSKNNTGKPKTLTVRLYKKKQQSDTTGMLIASQTVEVLYDVARREYFLYHDATTDAAPDLPTDDLDWRNFRENREDDENDTTKHKGWYQTQDKDKSYYYISKRNAYDELEQADKPWFGPMEIKQTPQTYNSWWNALDNATKNDKTKGIYTLTVNGENAVGMNADFIKAGALTIKPKTYVTNSGWVDDTDGKSVFETGWKFKKKTGNSSNGLNDAQTGDVLEPYVSIGGVDFTGFIPQKIGGRLLEYGVGEYSSSTEFPHYGKGTLGVRLTSAQSMTFAKYLKYEDNILQVGNTTSNSFASNEVYYRLCVATNDKTWDLCPGKSYTLTGSAKMMNFSTGDVLKFRAESYNSSWTGVSLIEVAKDSNYQTFECKFTVPLDAKGFHLGFQPYSSTGSSITSNNSFKGHFYLKDLKLIENALDVSGAYSWKFDQDNGLYMWQGAQTTTPIMKVDSGGLELTGKIHAEAGGTIGGWSLQDYTAKNHPEAYKLTAGNFNSDGFIGLYTAFYDDSYTINGHSDGSWRMIIGKNFGINNYGALYASAGSFGRMEIVDGTLQYSKDTNSDTVKITLGGEGLILNQNTSGSTNTTLTHGAVKIATSNNNYILLNTKGLMAQSYSDKNQTCCLDVNGIQWADNGSTIGNYSTQRAKIYYDATNGLSFWDNVANEQVYLQKIIAGPVFNGPYNITMTLKENTKYVVGKVYKIGGVVFGKLKYTTFSTGYNASTDLVRKLTIEDEEGNVVTFSSPSVALSFRWDFKLSKLTSSQYYFADVRVGDENGKAKFSLYSVSTSSATSILSSTDNGAYFAFAENKDIW